MSEFDDFVNQMFGNVRNAGAAVGAGLNRAGPSPMPVQPPPQAQSAISQAASGLPPQLVQMIAQAAQQANQQGLPPAPPLAMPNPSFQNAALSVAGPAAAQPVAQPPAQDVQSGKMEGETDYDYLTRRRKEDPTDPRDVIGRGAPAEVIPYVWVEYDTPQGAKTFFVPEERTASLPTGARVIDPAPVTDPATLVRAHQAGYTYERQDAATQAAFRTSEETFAATQAQQQRAGVDTTAGAALNPGQVAAQAERDRIAARDAALPEAPRAVTTEEIRAAGATDPEMARLAVGLDEAGIQRIPPDRDIMQDPQTGAISLAPKEETAATSVAMQTADSLMVETAAANAPAPRIAPGTTTAENRVNATIRQRVEATPDLPTSQLRQTNPAAANELEAAGIVAIPADQMVVRDANGALTFVPATETAPAGMTIVTYGGASSRPADNRPDRTLKENIVDTASAAGNLVGAVADRARQGTVGTLGTGLNNLLNDSPDPVQAIANSILGTLAEVGGPGAEAPVVGFPIWAAANREEVDRLNREGYDADDDGLADYTGGRAVWEAYIGEQDVGTRIISDLILDPLNYTVSAGNLLVRGGRAIQGSEALVPVYRRIVGAAMEAGGNTLRAPEILADDVLGNVAGAAGDVLKRIPGSRYLTEPTRATRIKNQTGKVRETLDDILARLSTDTPQGQQALGSAPAPGTGPDAGVGPVDIGADGTGMNPRVSGVSMVRNGPRQVITSGTPDTSIVRNGPQRIITTGNGVVTEPAVGRVDPTDTAGRTAGLPPSGARTGQAITEDGRAVEAIQPRLGVGRQEPDAASARTGTVPLRVTQADGTVSTIDVPRPGVGRVEPEPATANLTIRDPDGTKRVVAVPRRGVGRVTPDPADQPVLPGTRLDPGVQPTLGDILRQTTRAAADEVPVPIRGVADQAVFPDTPIPGAATTPAPAPAPAPLAGQMEPAGREVRAPFEGTVLGEQPVPMRPEEKPDWGFLAPQDRAGPTEAIRITDRAWELRQQYPEKWQQFYAEYNGRARRFASEQEGRNSVQYPSGAGFQRYQKDAVAEAAHVVDAVIPAFRRAFGDVEPIAEYRPRYRTDKQMPRKRDNELIETAVFDDDPGRSAAAMRVIESRGKRDAEFAAQMPEIQELRNRYLDQVSGTAAAPQQQLPTAPPVSRVEPARSDPVPETPAPAAPPQGSTVRPATPLFMEVRDVPTSQITTYREMADKGEPLPGGVDPQMREERYAESSADNVASNYNKLKYQNIVVKELPDGRYVVHSGHSRLQGFRDSNKSIMRVEIAEGTDEAVAEGARGLNTVNTPPTEGTKANLFRDFQDRLGQSTDQIARENNVGTPGVRGIAETERYISASHIPKGSPVWEAFDTKKIRLDVAAELGDAIRRSIVTPEELQGYYIRQVQGSRGLTAPQIRDDMIAHAQRMQNAKVEGTAMFGDDALGGSGFAQTESARAALRKERAGFVKTANAIKLTEKRAGGLNRKQVAALKDATARVADLDNQLRVDRDAQFVPTTQDAPVAPAAAETPLLRMMSPEDSAAASAQPSSLDLGIGPPEMRGGRTGTPGEALDADDLLNQPERTVAESRRARGDRELFFSRDAQSRATARVAADRTRDALDPNRMVSNPNARRLAAGSRFAGDYSYNVPIKARGRVIAGHEARLLSQTFEGSSESILERWERYADKIEQAGTGTGKKRVPVSAADADQQAAGRVMNDYAIDVLRKEDPKKFRLYESELDRLQNQLARPVKDPAVAEARALIHAMRGGKTGRAANIYDTILAVLREITLYNPLTGGVRYVLTQGVGNSITAMLTGNADMLERVWNRRNLRAAYDSLQEHPTNLIHSDADNVIAELGLGGMREDVGRIVRDEVTERGTQLKTRQVADKLRLGRVSTLVANQHIRDWANSIDLASREAKYAEAMVANITDARPVFRQIMRDRLPTPAAQRQFDDIFDALPQTFGSDRLRQEFAPIGPNYADRMARDWQETIGKMDTNARDQVRKFFFSGDETNADAVLRRVIFFHYWMSRATPLYMSSMMKNPGVLNAYMKTLEAMEEEAESGQYGESVKGFLHLMGTPQGYAIFIRPDAFFQTFVSFFEQSDFESEDENLLGKFMRKSGMFWNPVIDTVANLSGAKGDTFAADPLMLGQSVRLVQTGIDAFRSRTSDDARPTQNGYNNVMNWIRSKTSGILPGTENIAYKESMTGRRDINFLIQDVAEERGLDPTGVEAMAAMDDSSSPLYQEAFQRYADANGMRTVATILPTSVLYPKFRLERPDAINYEIEQLRTANPDDPALDPLYDQRTAANLNDPEARVLFQQQQEYATLGTPEQQAAYQTYNAIRYGGVETPVKINGTMVSENNLKRLTVDQREQAADLWAQQNGNAETIAAVQAERKAYRESHPELAAYTDWANSVRDYEGGVQGYWDDTAEGNPNAARWLETLDEPMTMDELEQQLTNPEAYHAWKGTQATVFDPNPISVNEGAPFSAGATATGTGTGFPPADPVKRIEENLTQYQQDSMLYDQAAAQVFGEPINMAGLNPMLRPAYEEELNSAGVKKPSLSGDARRYIEWAQVQPEGGDRSVAAFVAWDEQFKAQTNPGGGYDVDAIINMMMAQ